ncbi:MAG: pantoate--beta-alanine ligase [Nitrospirales bacterium]|nr:pantoate--beta-alanine ligase [Nitrospirales bacterium]
MEIITSPTEILGISKRSKAQGRTIGLVPTMGALHEGHLCLMREAKRENDLVVASIFVNPIQFGQNEDFDQYPRDLEGDSAKLKAEGVDFLFMPEARAMYPQGFATSIEVKGISQRLCGQFRPGHFSGVATVVCKLLNIVSPTRAYFGQKDYQQTLVIGRMVADLDMDVDIRIVPTKREQDGLAMSSRNVYLSSEERKAAVSISKALDETSRGLKAGQDITSASRIMHDILAAEPLIAEVQYAGIYDPESLEEAAEIKERLLLAIALKIGRTRLIDNMLVERP